MNITGRSLEPQARWLHSIIGVVVLWTVLLASPPPALAVDIVRDGVPNAEIVVAAERPRMVSLAALELQNIIERMSGARLPISVEPTGGHPVSIYVGRSAHTDALGVTDDGLEYGAYRIVSGDNWLVLLGSDFDYQPPEPWARRHGDIERAEADWDELTRDRTDSAWGFPFRDFFKKQWRSREPSELVERYGEDNARWWPGGSYGGGFWSDDEGGSLNAVYGWLETLGVRWYMPGSLGEVLPQRATIPLESLNLTVEPDFALRSWFWYNYSAFPLEDILWARRIGLNGGSEVLGGGQYGFAHGHVRVHGREAMQQAHSEYYALRGGVRDTEHRGYGTACYSSSGLEQETINYARFMFDHYDWPKFSIWPGDGFRHCQCELCAGKNPSELVWEFTDRVSRELYKSHPDRLVLGGAYTPYRAPPESIEEFSPNVVVIMANCGRPGFTVESSWQHYLGTVDAWVKRLAPGRLIRGDNNRYHMGETVEFPLIQATATARDLQMLKGISIGEISEQSQRRGILNPGANHLGLYVQASYLWDADQDLDTLLDEYFDLFYGPASGEMQSAFMFAESAHAMAVANATGRGARSPRNIPIADRIELVQRLQSARDKAGDSIYGDRIQLLMNEMATTEELEAMRATHRAMSQIREKNPTVVARKVGSATPAATHSLVDIVSGRRNDILETTFSVVWDGDALVFDIHCEEPDMENLFLTPQVWDGDRVSILLESPGHSYYQVEINPDGVLFDSDRGSAVGPRWKSQAQVESSRTADSWHVTVRIPVVSLAEGEADPNHNVAGTPPSAENPWYFNVGRARVRIGDAGRNAPGGKAALAFVPTGGIYHDPEKFAKLIVED